MQTQVACLPRLCCGGLSLPRWGHELARYSSCVQLCACIFAGGVGCKSMVWVHCLSLAGVDRCPAAVLSLALTIARGATRACSQSPVLHKACCKYFALHCRAAVHTHLRAWAGGGGCLLVWLLSSPNMRQSGACGRRDGPNLFVGWSMSSLQLLLCFVQQFIVHA